NEEKKTILIADDVKLFHIFIKQTLASKDYELVFVERGKEVLDFVMKKNVDLLILDVELPDMNGIEVLKSVRKLTQDMQSVVELKELPVIMVTAYPREEIKIEAEKLGVAGFFGKPIKRKEFKKLVEEILKEGYRGENAKKLILCVDSEPRVQRFYKGTLSDRNLQVLTASNGLEALEMVEYNRPNLIITELNLPEMDGVEMIKTIRETNPHLPIIVVSSVSEKEGSEKLKELKVEGYLSKPFKLRELKNKLILLLEKKSSEAKTNA
ncbi:response regulator, partial [Candidatus Aerophobetes bacterium]|nr:response regulator [Candidatus Aerophobetes bacterium]